MATIQTLNTRLKLKYDTLVNWNSVKDSFIPLKGEICFVEIPSGDETATTAPTVLFKVGDGTTPWGALKWGSALAADVYSWAKAASKPTYTANEVGVNETAFPGLNKTGTVTSVAVKMNGSNKGTVTSSGTIDLGTVVTDVSGKQDKAIDIEGITAKTVNDALKELADAVSAESGASVKSVSLASGTDNGTLKLTVDDTTTDNIKVTGLGTAAYKAAAAFDTAGAAAKVLGESTDAAAAATVYGAKAAAAAAQTTANGKYSKPAGGIPKTDLAKAVQTSLGKADTALQEHQTITTGSANGTIAVDGANVAVKGLAALAYKASLGKSDVGLGNVENKTLDTAVTASSANYITSGAVKTYVDNAVSGVTQFKYEVVTKLPTAAKDTMGKIYLVAHTHTTGDGYDEFITIESGNTTKSYSWEKIGNTDIDLTNYVNTLSGTANSGVITNLTKSGNTLTVTSTNLTTASPTGSGTTLSFIDTVSQAANGKITATKKTVSDVTQSAHGLMTAADKKKLDGIAEGATKVDESTVSGYGFTKNKGTVTGITMNNTALTVGTDGNVNLGTVITAHQSLDAKQDKITSDKKLSKDLVEGLGAAAAKGVDTSIAANTTSVNLPTSAAVETRINAHKGIDKVGTVTSVAAGVGLKVTGTASVAPKVEIDTAVTFVFDCGSASKLTDNTGIA